MKGSIGILRRHYAIDSTERNNCRVCVHLSWLRLLHLQLQTRLSLSGALFGPCIQSVRQHMPMIEALGAMHLDKWRSPYFLQLCSTIIDVLNLACLAALYVCSEPNAARLLLDWQVTWGDIRID